MRRMRRAEKYETLASELANGDQFKPILPQVPKLDRLARDLMIQETIIADLCQDDPTRKLMRQIGVLPDRL